MYFVLIYVQCENFVCSFSPDPIGHPITHSVTLIFKLVTELLKHDHSLHTALQPITGQLTHILTKYAHLYTLTCTVEHLIKDTPVRHDCLGWRIEHHLHALMYQVVFYECLYICTMAEHESDHLRLMYLFTTDSLHCPIHLLISLLAVLNVLL